MLPGQSTWSPTCWAAGAAAASPFQLATNLYCESCNVSGRDRPLRAAPGSSRRSPGRGEHQPRRQRSPRGPVRPAAHAARRRPRPRRTCAVRSRLPGPKKVRDGQAGPGTDRSRARAGGNGLMALPAKLPHHRVVLEEQMRRAAAIQLRIADWITAFAGSMNFVYLHVVLFTVWMLFIESKPWPTLTLIVSLEAVFLSPFRHDRPEPAGGVPAGQGGSRLHPAGTGAQDKHRADPATSTGSRPSYPGGSSTTAPGRRSDGDGARMYSPHPWPSKLLRARSARSVHGHPAISQESRPSITAVPALWLRRRL